MPPTPLALHAAGDAIADTLAVRLLLAIFHADFRRRCHIDFRRLIMPPSTFTLISTRLRCRHGARC